MNLKKAENIILGVAPGTTKSLFADFSLFYCTYLYKTCMKKSIYRNVSWEKQTNKWKAGFCHNGKYHYVGMFEDDLQAAKSVDNYRLEVLGDSSYYELNFPEDHNPPKILTCQSCGEIKPIELFTRKPHKKPAFKCFGCRPKPKLTTPQYLGALTPEKRIKWLVSRIKARALEENLEFNITPEYIYQLYLNQNGKCALTGMELTFNSGEGHVMTAFSVDKIVPSRGYTVGNIQILCFWANTAKRNIPQDEFINWCKMVSDRNT